MSILEMVQIILTYKKSNAVYFKHKTSSTGFQALPDQHKNVRTSFKKMSYCVNVWKC